MHLRVIRRPEKHLEGMLRIFRSGADPETPTARDLAETCLQGRQHPVRVWPLRQFVPQYQFRRQTMQPSRIGAGDDNPRPCHLVGNHRSVCGVLDPVASLPGPRESFFQLVAHEPLEMPEADTALLEAARRHDDIRARFHQGAVT